MPPDTTFPITIAELARIVEEAGTPTQGALAAFIWETLSSTRRHISGQIAADAYRLLGYEPFCGYPLVKLGSKP